MRLLARLSAIEDTHYNTEYHRSVRGRIWQALPDDKYAERHDRPVPNGFCFSNPFPFHGDIERDDQGHILISAVEEEMLAHIAEDLLGTKRFDIADMPFLVDDVTSISTDVGEPGTTGSIETPTGVCVRFDQDDCDEYGIEPYREDARTTYWEEEHGLEPFLDRVESNLQNKHELYGDPSVPGPAEVDGPLFEGMTWERNFAIPVTVSSQGDGVTTTIIASQWKFDYTVRSDAHRKHLNLALNCGLGERNGHGFGFLNITEKDGEEL